MLIATHGSPIYCIANLTIVLGWIDEAKAGKASKIAIQIDKIYALFDALKLLETMSERLELRACKGFASRAKEILLLAAEGNNSRIFEWNDFSKMGDNISALWRGILDEFNGRHVIILDVLESNLLMNIDPFGSKIYEAFPSARDDLEEAAKCIALNRWTAAVFHMMRAVELILRLLAKRYTVNDQNNWNNVLNELIKKLSAVSKREDGEIQEQWAAEMAAHLRNIKNAWRNHVMHSKEKYDEERSNVVWASTLHIFQSAVFNLVEQDCT